MDERTPSEQAYRDCLRQLTLVSNQMAERLLAGARADLPSFIKTPFTGVPMPDFDKIERMQLEESKKTGYISRNTPDDGYTSRKRRNLIINWKQAIYDTVDPTNSIAGIISSTVGHGAPSTITQMFLCYFGYSLYKAVAKQQDIALSEDLALLIGTAWRSVENGRRISETAPAISSDDLFDSYTRYRTSQRLPIIDRARFEELLLEGGRISALRIEGDAVHLIEKTDVEIGA